MRTLFCRCFMMTALWMPALYAGPNTPPYLALGLDPYLGSTTRAGLSVELLNYPFAARAIGLGVETGFTLIHRESFYNGIVQMNYVRGEQPPGFNFKLMSGLRYCAGEIVSRDFAVSYALPWSLGTGLTPRLGIVKRMAVEDTTEQTFLFKERRRSNHTDFVLSMELITGRLNR